MTFTNQTSKEIWQDRYQKNNETLRENIERVARHCATNEEDYMAFEQLMGDGLFFPAGRTMSNAGIGRTLTLNNCYVSPMIKDDMTDIFNKVKLGALTHKAGGGIGYSFSQLRPNGTPTSNDAIASGAISFMDVFNAQTATIMQGSRRGANMAVMSVYSMDIEEFITAKSKDPSRLQHFNISVMVDDDFMKAKDNNQDIWLHYPVYDEDGNILKNQSEWTYKKSVNAKSLWDLIIKEAYNTGEPGIFFQDTMNKDNNLWYIENIVATNPCAEYLAGTVYGNHPTTGQRLNSDEYGGACNLGSLFLHNFVDKPFTNSAQTDYGKLENAIYSAVRMLDNIIDINHYPDEIYKNYQHSFRVIGLGVTGLADMLCMLGLRYSSQQAQLFVWDLMNFIALHAYRASIELAKEKGSFPFLDKEKFVQSGYLQKHAQISDEWKQVIEDIKQHGIRNAKILSIAPTGTLSLTFGNNCSSGIEPIFSLEYDRKVKIGGQDEDNTQIIKVRDYAYDLWLNTTNKTVGKDVFVTAMEMSVEDHIDMLKNIAFHVDMGISKTINIPTEYSFEKTKEVYDKCYTAGIKGATIFRPNPIRQGILIADDNSKNKGKTISKECNAPKLERGVILNVTDDVIGKKRKLTTGCGTLHCIALFDPINGDLLETYLSKGSSGGCNNFMTGLSRMISLSARGGLDIYSIIDQLRSSGTCPSYSVRKAIKGDVSKGSSCPVAVSYALLDMHKEVLNDLGIDDEYVLNNKEVKQVDHVAKKINTSVDNTKERCPECKEEIISISGCVQCVSCGWSQCN